MKLISVILVLLAPLLTSCHRLVLPVDCSDIHTCDNSRPSGVYNIYPTGTTPAVQVYCDMNSLGGQWMVFHRRTDGSVNFYRGWEQYKAGFGNPAGEYWLGLESLHQTTQRKRYELLVGMDDFEGNKVYARYSSFSVDAESNGYTLHVSGFSGGGAVLTQNDKFMADGEDYTRVKKSKTIRETIVTLRDALSYHNGMKFSTFDHDHDTWRGNCARSFLGAFWYNGCYLTNPTSLYYHGPHSTVNYVGVTWATWKGTYSLKFISMKIRPVQEGRSSEESC